MGRYVPPDQEGVISGNQLNKKHALGARASKLRSEGILTVRFEMPFAVWCSTCPKPTVIGQGVRFNAEKKKVGNYYSSPIFSFRMKHTACGGTIEIRTDPANTAYVVVSGGRKRDTGDEGASESLVAGGVREIVTAKEHMDQRDSAFANLEKTIEDREVFEAAKERIGELEDASSRQWDDPYARNAALRKAFRVGRKAREKDAAAMEELKDRMGLGIEMLPEHEDDAKRAALVTFGTVDGEGETGVRKALAKPLFNSSGSSKDKPSKTPESKGPKKLKSEVAAAKLRESLVSEIVGNTRMTKDPFLESRNKEATPRSTILLPGLKRKRASDDADDTVQQKSTLEKTGPAIPSLVDYDSD